MRIALHVFQAAVPPVRKSRRHAQTWKNIPVDRISSVSTRIGAADDAFIITFVSRFRKRRVALPVPGLTNLLPRGRQEK
jgi:hypothetical protein